MANNNDNTSMVELILNQEDLNINHQSEDGNTPLMTAAQLGNLQLVKLLIEHNADIHLKNKQGETALTLAEKNNHTAVKELLLEVERAQNVPSLR